MFAAGKPPRGAGGKPPRGGDQIKPYGGDIPAYGGGRGPMPGKPMPSMGGGFTPRPTSMPMTNVMPVKPGMGMMMKKGGKVKSASSRADGCVVRGKTKGKIV